METISPHNAEQRRLERTQKEVPPSQNESMNRAPEREGEPEYALTQKTFNAARTGPLFTEPMPRLRRTEDEQEAPFGSMEDDDDVVEFQRPLLHRLASNRIARALMTAAGISVGVQSAASGVEAFRNIERAKEIQNEIVDAMYPSSLDVDVAPRHALDVNETVTLENDTEYTRGEMLEILNEKFNEQTFGLSGLAEGIADTKHGIDLYRFNLAYGNQVPLAPEAQRMLEVAVDLDQIEFNAVANILRNSILQRADLGNGMFYHDNRNLNMKDAPRSKASINRERFELSLTIARDTVKSLDLDARTPQEREDATRIIAEALRETIEADNMWTLAANYTAHADVMAASYDRFLNEQLTPEHDEALLAWKKVSALEREKDGQVHAIAEAVIEGLEGKKEVFERKAGEVGIGGDEKK